MNQKHVPDLELCQELDRLCKEKNITLPETEFAWDTRPNGVVSFWGNRKIVGDYIPAPLVSEQGEWLKDYMEDKENDGEAVPDDMPKADRMGLLWEPNFMQKVLNYLLAEGIITTL